jgi:hypothetical protein
MYRFKERTRDILIVLAWSAAFLAVYGYIAYFTLVSILK